MFRNYQHSDPFNLNRKRSTRNTNKRTYNCAGYALGTYSWYCPHDGEKDHIHDYSFDTVEEAWQETLMAVAHMVRDFPTLRVIKQVGEATRKERVIAFRLSSDGDFHYLKRAHNNRWYHKRGSKNCIEHMTDYEAMNMDWCDRYDGPIVLMAIEK